MKRILSIDGGGIRGIIPACTLVALEQTTGTLTRECFDYVAGTSTGALIAAAVAVGIPAAQILEIYTDRSKQIFTPGPPVSTVKRLTAGYMYNPANIQKVLKSVFGASANWTLNDSPIGLLITAKDIDTHPWYFTRDNPKNAGTTGKLGLIDCAVASASAPTYFKPWAVEMNGLQTTLVDGGVGVTGNPVYEACVEAFYYDYFTPADTKVVSLGTGYFPASGKTPCGLLGWLGWTVDTLLDAPEDQQTEIVNRHWPGIMKRFDWKLPQKIDMADTGSIDLLVSFGTQAAAGMDWKSILQ